ncbi:Nucleolar protein 10 [Trapelia coarctata]|nr:Nucleolar protein 10 [Trapelia coarctata]
MKLTNHSAVPVYTISGSSTARPLPEWLARKRKRSLKNDPEYASRIELLQDFEFEEASQCIRISDDGDWVMSTGTYKPQIHTHYLPHLSLSYARHTISLNTTFLLLSPDHSKSIHLQADRSIEFHTPQGCHYTTRIPRYGRDLKYDKRSAEALIPAVGVNENGLGEVFRLNLELGRYMRAYEVEVGGDDLTSAGGGALQGGIATGSVNTAAIAEESHNLLAFGTSLGTVEFWDPRSRARIGLLQPPYQSDPTDGRQEITALEFHRSGLNVATGSSTGLIHLYDLRSPKPFLKKDQGYGYPIQNLIYLTPSSQSRGQSSDPHILSSDKRIIKIWDTRDGTPWTSVEPAVDLNSVAWCKDSGMLLTANEGRQQHAFFIPQLGPAPKWCSFLDNLVEEMAEDPNDPNAFTTQRAGEVYDNYKFLTLKQLEALNLAHLVGTTTLLRPYMHGYFVAQRLYDEAKMIADPFVWEEQRAKRVREKIESERESRIRGNKKVTMKVNKRLAEKILEREEKNERRKARRVLKNGGDDPDVVETADTDADAVLGDTDLALEKETVGKGLLADPRFAKLFEDEAYAIDETSREFRDLNPSTVPFAAEKRERGLTAVEAEMEDGSAGSSDGDDDTSSDDDDDDGGNGAERETGRSEKKAKDKDKDTGRVSSASYKRSGHSSRQVHPQQQMRVSSSRKPTVARDRSFGSRATRGQGQNKNGKNASRGGAKPVFRARTITVEPRERKAGNEGKGEGGDGSGRKGERRSASGNVFRGL